MTDNQQRNVPQQQNDKTVATKQQYLNDTASVSDSSTDFNDPRTMDARKLYIGCIDKSTTEKDLIEHFEQFGEIVKVILKIPTSINRSAFAFISFKDLKAVQMVLNCKNHVINNKTLICKKAISKHYKLYVGGLSPNIRFWDIKNYFTRFASNIYIKMPYTKNELRGYCFISFDNPQIINNILNTSPHVINGTQIEVERTQKRNERYDTKTYENFRRMPNSYSRCDEGDFLPQNSYVQVPYYVNIGYDPYNQFSGYGYPYPYYGYPNYNTYPEHQYEGYEPIVINDTLSDITEEQDFQCENHEPFEIDVGIHENIVKKDDPEMEPVKDQEEKITRR